MGRRDRTPSRIEPTCDRRAPPTEGGSHRSTVGGADLLVGQRPVAARRPVGAATRWCRGPAGCATAGSRFDGVDHQTADQLRAARHPRHRASSSRGRSSTQGIDYVELTCRLDWPLGGVAAPASAARRRRAHVHADVVRASDGRCRRRSAGIRGSSSPQQADLQFERMYLRDDEYIPTGRPGSPPPPPPVGRLLRPARSAPLRLRYRAGSRSSITSDCDHWVVYDKPAHATCVEPQTGPPDASTWHPRSAGAHALEPGEMLQRTMTIALAT